MFALFNNSETVLLLQYIMFLPFEAIHKFLTFHCYLDPIYLGKWTWIKHCFGALKVTLS